MSQFQFGEFAICTAVTEARFNERREAILGSIQPDNIVEAILAEELLHASWELERVRTANADTKHHSRASRNWHRSLKQLKRLQSARASHTCDLYWPEEQKVAAQCPLADLKKLPKPLVIDTKPAAEVQ